MKVTYQREIKRNYLIIDPETVYNEGYERKMLQDNPVEGLLHFQVRQKEDGIRFYYDITSRQPLMRILEGKKWRAEEVRSLIIGIFGVLERMEQYLLKEAQLWLDPEYIYVEPDNLRVWLCFVPGMTRDFSEDLGKLLEKILERIDHQDPESVMLAYGIYQATKIENYGMDDIMRVMQKREGGEREKTEKRVVVQEQAEWTEQQESFQRVCSENVSEHSRERMTGTSKRQELFLEKSRRQESVLERAAEKRGILERLRSCLKKWRQQPEEQDFRVQVPWEEMFGQEQEELTSHSESQSGTGRECVSERRSGSGNGSMSERTSGIGRWSEPQSGDEYPGTVLLADLSHSAENRRLRALDAGLSDIEIPYYPYIIGKHPHLSDYQIEREGVSRLHLRIDREDSRYYLQDLNSTNGTRLCGRMLGNNEKAEVQIGDEVCIAACCYRFE